MVLRVFFVLDMECKLMEVEVLESLSKSLFAIAELVSATVRNEKVSPRIRCRLNQVRLRQGGGICVHYTTLVEKADGGGDDIVEMEKNLSWKDLKYLLK